MFTYNKGFPSSSDGKESICKAGDLGLIPGSGRSSGEELATHFSTLAYRIPWTKEPVHGVAQSWTGLTLSLSGYLS